ncbi:hypothetical protein KP509_14G059600 [Ceratopteris richardii]|uniref:Uncharacterized protein n=1 Tax=Ceratopteris richardii TaxID=49495 RepID=A0A8T2TC70_CERRI|nr:hypothetical protein KP509_14G059600 [Ceratopteris richardii]
MSWGLPSRSSRKEADGEADAPSVKSPSVVRLPRVSVQTASISHSAEEPGDEGSKHLWQVYALGGFMVGRWIWARWRERKDARGTSGSDEY